MVLLHSISQSWGQTCSRDYASWHDLLEHYSHIFKSSLVLPMQDIVFLRSRVSVYESIGLLLCRNAGNALKCPCLYPSIDP